MHADQAYATHSCCQPRSMQAIHQAPEQQAVPSMQLMHKYGPRPAGSSCICQCMVSREWAVPAMQLVRGDSSCPH